MNPRAADTASTEGKGNGQEFRAKAQTHDANFLAEMKKVGMRYGGLGIPRKVPKGRVLAHNDIHAVKMPGDANGFRWWSWPEDKVPANFKTCGRGYTGLPHVAKDHAANYKCEKQASTSTKGEALSSKRTETTKPLRCGKAGRARCSNTKRSPNH